MAITTLILFSVICGLLFYFAQMRLRLTHSKISDKAKKDIFLVLVFLPVNLLIIAGPHFLLVVIAAWQEIIYGRVILLATQALAAISLTVVLWKNKSHAETT